MRDRMLLPCPEALDRFGLYLDGELGEADARPVEDHLKACDSCRSGAGEMAALHRDLARRIAREETEAGDPVPALLAKSRWEKAVASRARRTTRLARVEGGRPVWFPIAAAAGIAACLLLTLLALDRSPSPRKTAKSQGAPEVDLPREPQSAPAPAPRLVVVPRTEPPPILPHRVSAPGPETPRPAPEPPPAPPVLRPAPTVETPPAIARVERVDGAVSLKAGHAFAIGETLVTEGPSSRAVVAYPDGTRIYVAGETSITLGGRGKAVAIARGEVAADVAPQRDEPMTFTTPVAEVKVLGTWLSVASRPESTLVQVEKGRVQVTRRRDPWGIPLHEGQYTVVEAGNLPVAKPLPANLLADPGFEAYGKGWEGIFNRAMGRNYGGVSVTPDVYRSGKRSLQLITQPVTGYDREVFQDFPAGPGDAFDIAGWLRTAGIGGRGVSLSLLWLGAGDFSGELVGGLRSKGAVIREDVAGTLTGANDWTRLSARAIAPPPAKQVRVLLFADVDPGGPATAWFDDMVLRRAPKGK